RACRRRCNGALHRRAGWRPRGSTAYRRTRPAEPRRARRRPRCARELGGKFQRRRRRPNFLVSVARPARTFRIQDGQHPRQHDWPSNPRYSTFGWAAARADDILNTVPAPLSGVLLATAAVFAKNGRPGHALAIMPRDGRQHHSPNAGWPESAMAGALGLALAGPRRYPEGLVADPWLGDGSARAGVSDILRGLHLYRLACLIQCGLLVDAWLAMHATLLA